LVQCFDHSLKFRLGDFDRITIEVQSRIVEFSFWFMKLSAAANTGTDAPLDKSMQGLGVCAPR
jgi:hypothetical protein